MNLHQLLDQLETDGATLTATGERLRLAGPQRLRVDPEVATIITANKKLLLAHVAGIIDGHAIGFCTVCGEPSVVAVKKPSGDQRSTWPTCRLTPRCEGRHVPRDADVQRRRHAPAPPPQAKAPARPRHCHLLGPRPPWPDPPARW